MTKATRFGIELAGRLAVEQCRTFTAAAARDIRTVAAVKPPVVSRFRGLSGAEKNPRVLPDGVSHGLRPQLMRRRPGLDADEALQRMKPTASLAPFLLTVLGERVPQVSAVRQPWALSNRVRSVRARHGPVSREAHVAADRGYHVKEQHSLVSEAGKAPFGSKRQQFRRRGRMHAIPLHEDSIDQTTRHSPGCGAR